MESNSSRQLISLPDNFYQQDTNQVNGVVCVFSLKNPSYPEYLCTAGSGVTAVDIHPSKKTLYTWPFILVHNLFCIQWSILGHTWPFCSSIGQGCVLESLLNSCWGWSFTIQRSCKEQFNILFLKLLKNQAYYAEKNIASYNCQELWLFDLILYIVKVQSIFNILIQVISLIPSSPSHAGRRHGWWQRGSLQLAEELRKADLRVHS